MLHVKRYDNEATNSMENNTVIHEIDGGGEHDDEGVIEHVVIKPTNYTPSPATMLSRTNTARKNILRSIILTQQPNFGSIADMIAGSPKAVDAAGDNTNATTNTAAFPPRSQSAIDLRQSRMDTERKASIVAIVSRDERLKRIMDMLAGTASAVSTADDGAGEVPDVADVGDGQQPAARTIASMLRTKSEANLRNRSPEPVAGAAASVAVADGRGGSSGDKKKDARTRKKKKKKGMTPRKKRLTQRLRELSTRVTRKVNRPTSEDGRPQWNASTSLFDFSIQTHRNQGNGAATSAGDITYRNGPKSARTPRVRRSPSNNSISMDSDGAPDDYIPDLTVGHHVQLLRCRSGSVRAMRLVGEYMWVATVNGGIRAYHINALRRAFSVTTGTGEKRSKVFQVQSICPQRGRVWIGDKDGIVYSLTPEGELLFRHKTHTGSIMAIDASHPWTLADTFDDPGIVFNGASGRGVKPNLWSVSDGFSIVRHDARNGQEVVRVQAHGPVIAMVAVHLRSEDDRGTPSNSARVSLIPEQMQLWTIIHGSICVWDSRGRIAARLRQRGKKGSKIKSKALSLAVIGQTVWSGGIDGSICVWRISDASLIRCWHAHVEPVKVISAVGYGIDGVSEVWTATGVDNHIGVWSSHGEHYGTITLSRGHPTALVATEKHVWIGSTNGLSVVSSWRGWPQSMQTKFANVGGRKAHGLDDGSASVFKYTTNATFASAE